LPDEACADEERIESLARELCQRLPTPIWKDASASELDQLDLASFMRANTQTELGRFWVNSNQHLDKMPGLSSVYEQIIKRHLKPLMEQMWVTFKLQKISAPYVLKYSAEPDAIRAMELHHDLETLTLVTYLNEEFTGGGTYFPRWNYHTGKPAPGSAILYPGGLSHEHEGVAITEGTRYLLCGSFY
jgi:hypothetical protein